MQSILGTAPNKWPPRHSLDTPGFPLALHSPGRTASCLWWLSHTHEGLQSHWEKSSEIFVSAVGRPRPPCSRALGSRGTHSPWQCRGCSEDRGGAGQTGTWHWLGLAASHTNTFSACATSLSTVYDFPDHTGITITAMIEWPTKDTYTHLETSKQGTHTSSSVYNYVSLPTSSIINYHVATQFHMPKLLSAHDHMYNIMYGLVA